MRSTTILIISPRHEVTVRFQSGECKGSEGSAEHRLSRQALPLVKGVATFDALALVQRVTLETVHVFRHTGGGVGAGVLQVRALVEAVKGGVARVVATGARIGIALGPIRVGTRNRKSQWQESEEEQSHVIARLQVPLDSGFLLLLTSDRELPES